MSPPLKVWVAGARPRTLPAAVVPVAVGTAVGYLSSGQLVISTTSASCHAGMCVAFARQLSWLNAVLALVVALGIQVGTNYVNDYADGARGTDARRVGPVRLVGQGLATVGQVKLAASAAFAVAGLAGPGARGAGDLVVSPPGAHLCACWMGVHRRASPIWLPRFRGDLRVRVLRSGGHGWLGVRATRPLLGHFGRARVVVRLRLGLRPLGRRPGRTAGDSAPPSEQPPGHRHRPGGEEEDIGHSPRAERVRDASIWPSWWLRRSPSWCCRATGGVRCWRSLPLPLAVEPVRLALGDQEGRALLPMLGWHGSPAHW